MHVCMYGDRSAPGILRQTIQAHTQKIHDEKPRRIPDGPFSLVFQKCGSRIVCSEDWYLSVPLQRPAFSVPITSHTSKSPLRSLRDTKRLVNEVAVGKTTIMIRISGKGGFVDILIIKDRFQHAIHRQPGYHFARVGGRTEQFRAPRSAARAEVALRARPSMIPEAVRRLLSGALPARDRSGLRLLVGVVSK